jgi:hypothetical protein
MRIMKSAIDLKKKQGGKVSDAYSRYCKLKTLDTSEEKFCYDLEPLHKEVFRILDLGADASRVCKKVKSINAEFCKSRSVSKTLDNQRYEKNKKRGIIYE